MTEEEALKIIGHSFTVVDNYGLYTDDLNEQARQVAIKSLERETKPGYWVYKNGIRYCEFCGASNSTAYANYCPNCGKKLVESQESEEQKQI